MPEKIVSDNGSYFISSEFTYSKLKISHETNSSLHSSGSDQVERTIIGIVKLVMKMCTSQGGLWKEALLATRTTLVSIGLLAPEQYLQGRLLRDSTPLSESS